jgi:methylglutaconyl-CoA hydratase
MSNNDVILDIAPTGIASLTLNRPNKHNAFDDSIIADLTTKLNQVASNPDVRVLILQATGKNFSAGADLGWMKRMAELDQLENEQDADKLALLMKTLNSLPVPTIARVQGASFGGAVGLVACCDIAVGASNSSFSLSEVKLGLAPATISPYVIAAIGARQCRRLFLTAERFNAATAKTLGLLHEVVEPDELDEAIEGFTTQLLANGPEAIKASKQLIQHIDERPLDDHLISQTSELIAQLRVSQEGQAGLKAFFDKRVPYWHPEYNHPGNTPPKDNKDASND